MLTRIQQLATLLLFISATCIDARPNRRLQSRRLQQVEEAKREVTDPITYLTLEHHEHIISKDTIKQAIEGGRKTQQTKGTRPADLHSFLQTCGTYDVAATNVQNSYTVPILLGSRKTSYSLLVDTGSSITWVGAQDSKPYKSSSTTDDSGQAISVSYGSGSFSGELYYDTVALGDLSLTDQGIASATSSQGFQSGVDGIIGFAPVALTRGLLSPNPSDTVPTITDTAYKQKRVPSEILGVYFQPSFSRSNQNGEITIGGYDTSRISGSVIWTPKSTKNGVKSYWGVNLALSACGQDLLSGNGGIVDTGTTAIFIASDAFKTYSSLIPDAVVDSSTGLLRIPKSSLDSIPDLTFEFDGASSYLTLNKYAQLFDPSIQGIFGLSTDYYYSWVVDLGTSTGSGGFDFILGQKFLERFYSIYDTTNSRVGFGKTGHSSPSGFGQ